jgi:histone H1/5
VTSAVAQQAPAPKAAAPKAAAPKAAARKAAAPKAAAAQGPAVGGWSSYVWTSALAQTVPVVVQQAGGAGAWSVVQQTAPPPPIIVNYAVVRGDRKTYTLQITTHEQPDAPPLSVTQVTVDRASGRAVRSLIQRPKGVIATPESGLRPVRPADVAQGRPEEITVPAGRFTATHGTARGVEVWASDQVPALGLVKAMWQEGVLELRASNPTGATDLFKTASR